MQMTSSSPQHHSQVSLTKMPQQPVATISVQPRPPTENSISVVQQNSIPPVQVLPHHQAAKTRPGNLLQEETAHSAQVNLQGYMVRDQEEIPISLEVASCRYIKFPARFSRYIPNYSQTETNVDSGLL